MVFAIHETSYINLAVTSKYIFFLVCRETIVIAVAYANQNRSIEIKSDVRQYSTALGHASGSVEQHKNLIDRATIDTFYTMLFNHNRHTSIPADH